MKVLGIITARGGSKGIPRKNLAPLLGKPLIYYTIQASKNSKRMTRTVLLSDDDEIITQGKKYRADVPFVLPYRLAGDRISPVEVMIYTVQFLEQYEHINYDFVLLLQPTAPLRTAQDIDEAIEKLVNSDADSIVSVARLEEPHPAKMMVVKEGLLAPFLPDQWHERLRRQDLEPIYFLNGAIYCVRRNILIEQESLWGKKTLAYVMPQERSVNIDSSFDLLLAERILLDHDNRSYTEL